MQPPSEQAGNYPTQPIQPREPMPQQPAYSPAPPVQPAPEPIIQTQMTPSTPPTQPLQPLPTQVAGAPRSAQPHPGPQQPTSSVRANWVSFSQLRGHPLVDITEGREIGEVHDLLIDEQRRIIQAFATKGRLLHGPTFVPALKATIGPDAVTFQPGALAGQDTSWLDKLPRATDLIGMQVLTNTGQLLGTVDDLRLDPNSNSLAALELKPAHTGILHRLGSGRRLLPASGVISYGPDTIIALEQTTTDL